MKSAIRIVIIFFYIFSIYHCTFSQEKSDKLPEPVNCQALNTEADDFAPSWNKYENQLYFNSTITGYSNFYTSQLINASNWSQPKLLKSPLNLQNNNQSYITFESPEEAYLSTFRLSERRSYLNIFKTMKKKQAWTKPYPLDSLISDSFSGHPSVSPDGSILIFSSDRNSETEDTDLWTAYKQGNASWSSPIRIDELNTPGNEITPFLSSNDTLFFATNGQEGPGGYDVFYSVRFEGIWQRPKPVNEINTEFDESDFTRLPDGTILFASNRPGGKGGLDIYSFLPVLIAQTKELAPEPELTISTLVASIELKKYFKYEEYPVIPYIFINEGNSVPRSIGAIQDLNISKITNSVDSIYKYSPSFISDRIKNFSNSKLYMKFNINPNSPEYSIDSPESMVSYFRQNGKLDKEHLIIEKRIGSNNDANMDNISLNSDISSIFSPLEIGKDSLSIEPPILDVIIDSKTKTNLQTLECTMLVGRERVKPRSSAKDLPVQISFDLKPYIAKLTNIDSIMIEVSAINSDGKLIFQNQSINVQHKDIKEKNVINIAGNNYYQYFLFYVDKEDINNSNIYHETFMNILENIKSSKKITVQYFNNKSALSMDIADSLINELKKQSVPNNFTITKEYQSATEFFTFSERFSPYIFRILVEL